MRSEPSAGSNEGGGVRSCLATPIAQVARQDLTLNPYAKDLFTAFQKEGLQNPAVGARYRQDILAPARMLEPDVLVKNVLGRSMSPQAHDAYLGIKFETR